jgi:hypothetical protein
LLEPLSVLQAAKLHELLNGVRLEPDTMGCEFLNIQVDGEF